LPTLLSKLIWHYWLVEYSYMANNYCVYVIIPGRGIRRKHWFLAGYI